MYSNKQHATQHHPLALSQLKHKQARTTTVYDSKGNVIGGGGSSSEYKYFGAARDLPGVREMLAERERAAKERAEHNRRQRQRDRRTEEEREQQRRREDEELGVRTHRHVTPEYYGFAPLDEEEAAMVADEQECERARLAEAQLEWDAKSQEAGAGGSEAAWDDDEDYDARLERALAFVERV